MPRYALSDVTVWRRRAVISKSLPYVREMARVCWAHGVSQMNDYFDVAFYYYTCYRPPPPLVGFFRFTLTTDCVQYLVTYVQIIFRKIITIYIGRLFAGIVDAEEGFTHTDGGSVDLHQ